ncbi:hypothetical protein F0562_009040 [Nyssa sinensis]|uniref:Transmembrane protein n=1 Tax=Nyssa sinensis TaxID=561372 RepID=A0A5J5ABN3_9ASTE|nr:hypothetical protein F0562_009040 [Nyssa sinensis]
MEALWNLEDKWKLSTREAVLLFVFTACLVIGLCTATALKKSARRKQLVEEEQEPAESPAGWCSIKKVLTSSVRWSGASKWDERFGGHRESPTPLLGRGREGDVGWQSHGSDSPVWQRPILMGEKCELPRFSGLILYDERGRLLHHFHKESTYQDKTATVVRKTLRDLL